MSLLIHYTCPYSYTTHVLIYVLTHVHNHALIHMTTILISTHVLVHIHHYTMTYIINHLPETQKLMNIMKRIPKVC